MTENENLVGFWLNLLTPALKIIAKDLFPNEFREIERIVDSSVQKTLVEVHKDFDNILGLYPLPLIRKSLVLEDDIKPIVSIKKLVRVFVSFLKIDLAEAGYSVESEKVDRFYFLNGDNTDQSYLATFVAYYFFANASAELRSKGYNVQIHLRAQVWKIFSEIDMSNNDSEGPWDILKIFLRGLRQWQKGLEQRPGLDTARRNAVNQAASAAEMADATNPSDGNRRGRSS